MRRVRARVPTGPAAVFLPLFFFLLLSFYRLSSSLLPSLSLSPVLLVLSFSAFPFFRVPSLSSAFNLFAIPLLFFRGELHDELRFDARQACTIVLRDCPVIRSYYHARETWRPVSFDIVTSSPYSVISFFG